MKNLKTGLIFLGTFIFIIVASAVELHYIRLETVSITTRVILIILLNLNILALLTLMFFVGKNLLKLYIERKQKILGYKFKTKIVVVFVILTSIPAALLFVLASGLVTNYIDRLLTPQFKQPLSSSLEVAKTVYELERQKTLKFAKSFTAGKFSPEYTITHITEIPENPTETIKGAFEGKEGTEVISGDNGDIIRAVVPEYLQGKRIGILVAETRLPKNISTNVEKIKSAYEDYIKIESWKEPLKINYLFILAFFTLIIVFMSLWVALRIAKGITDPIQNLAQATKEVASGNLDVSVRPTPQREDEIGLLIDSFNRMVSGLKDAKEKLQRSYLESDMRRLKLENILENIRSGVVFLDLPGNIQAINSSACSILNIKPDDVINRHYRELMLRITSEELHELINSIIVKDLSGIEKEVRAQVGEKRLILRVFVATLRDDASPIGLLVVFDDLTDVIKAQKALAWEEIARRIAHEIKNPLTPIKLSAERMLKKWETKDRDFDHIFEHSAKTIVKEVDSLKKLVDEFSRLGKMPEIKKASTNLPGIIGEILALYTGYKGFSINASISDNIPLVEMDGEQFKRVLINIFNNAFQAMGSSGNIDVKVHMDRSRERVLIDIADDGPGMREEDKEKIFLPYFSTKKGGTGLGLAIANRIITEHGGYIRVRDNVPRGTVFTIDMPVKGYTI